MLERVSELLVGLGAFWRCPTRRVFWSCVNWQGKIGF
jgi:hypothetical protein